MHSAVHHTSFLQPQPRSGPCALRLLPQPGGRQDGQRVCGHGHAHIPARPVARICYTHPLCALSRDQARAPCARFHSPAAARLASACAAMGTRTSPFARNAAPYTPPTAAAHAANAQLRPPPACSAPNSAPASSAPRLRTCLPFHLGALVASGSPTLASTSASRD